MRSSDWSSDVCSSDLRCRSAGTIQGSRTSLKSGRARIRRRAISYTVRGRDGSRSEANCGDYVCWRGAVRGNRMKVALAIVAAMVSQPLFAQTAEPKWQANEVDEERYGMRFRTGTTPSGKIGRAHV